MSLDVRENVENSMRRHTETTLVRAPEAARQARRIVARACADWRIRSVGPDAEIVVTELVENTLQHTGSPPRLRLVLRDGALTVAVSDADLTTVYVREEGERQTRGFGMLLVSRLSKVWGCTRARAGKTVWAELRTRP
jgi:anti-sigma regulatory factor (Ser/Thr protein kinase)